MGYIKFRKKYGLLFLILFPSVVMMMALLWKKSMLILFCLMIIFPILEMHLVKCPTCRMKVIKPFEDFPEKCPHCGRDL